MLEAGTIVAAKVRRVDHLYRQLVFSRQREKAAGKREDFANEAIVDPVPDQIKKAHVASSVAQILQEQQRSAAPAFARFRSSVGTVYAPSRPTSHIPN